MIVSAGGWIRFVLIVFGFASILPAIFTVVLVLRGNPDGLTIAVLWGLMWAIGAIVVVVSTVGLAHEQADLRGGVFIRWTGPYHVQLVGAGRGGGTRVQFRVGGRDLQSDGGIQSLYSIESGTGGIDFLPVGGVLLEVRDESGRTLWSRVSPLPGGKAEAY